MNVAYLDPPYSRYFERLAVRIAARTGGDVVALLSSPAYRAYVGDDAHHIWPAGRVPDPPPLPPNADHAVWSQVADLAFRSVFWHTVEWFRERFRAGRIGLCLVFSDARPFSLAASVAANELGVRCVYFERGAFRYVTASVSPLGLNARFGLARAQQQPHVTGLGADAVLERRAQEPWLRLRFARFLLANGLACLREPDRHRLQHKRYAIGPYLRLALSQWWTEHRLGRRDDAGLQREDQAPCVVVPLQLPADSQLRLYSPFEGNQAFIDFVADRVRRVAPDARLLVKRHPMDSGSYRLPPWAHWVGGNLSRFFHAPHVVVCINSTVGFEAAIRGVPVICFAPSFYTEAAPLVSQVLPGEFPDALARGFADRPDPAAGRALREAVMRWYQAPGDAWAFTDEDLDRTAGIVLQHLAEPETVNERVTARASA